MSPAEFRAVHAKLTDPTRRTHAGSSARKWIGAGLYLCDRCSANGMLRPVKSGIDGTKGRTWRIYHCPDCHRSWKGEPIDAWVTGLVAARLAQPDLDVLLQRDGEDGQGDALRTERIGIRENLVHLAEMLANGVATPEQFRVGTTRMRERLADVERQLEELSPDGVRASLATADDPVALWLGLDDVARRQAYLRTLVEIRLGTPIRGRAKWDAAKFVTWQWL